MEEDRSAFKMLTGKATGRDLQEGLAVDFRTILESILKKYEYVSTMYWVDSTQDRDNRISLVNAALNLRVP